MTTDIITRQQAKEQGLPYYITGVPCNKGHVSPRSTKRGTCRECVRLAHYAYYANHKDTALQCISKWQTKNKAKVNEATHKWRTTNPDQAKTTVDNYYKNNREAKLQRNKNWRERNKPLLQFYNSKRRAQIKRASVDWADVKKMVALYEQSISMTESTGIPHQVDHIIPLQHELVCGLHWEGNLQVLTTEDNQRKSNRLDDY